MRGRLGLGGRIAAPLVAAAVTLAGGASSAAGTPGASEAAHFVGSEVCAGCHRAEAALWRGSQHRQAMDHASDKTVLGDFGDAAFDSHGVRSRFFRVDSRHMVETDGPDGKLGVFEIKYTFGVYPLQQYLVEFPDGRVQALSIAWDSRAKEQGGQRWFHLYPAEHIRHDDILHWTKINQNWNFMCAECHSTGVRKTYDAARDHFATTWTEISVGCEACHGEGSQHVAWAKGGEGAKGGVTDPGKGLLARFDERRGVNWSLDAHGAPRRSAAPQVLRKEVETCGRCHARRGQFSEEWKPGRDLSETHMVSPLTPGLYHADGQMLDEVFNYGSFKQSKMFAAGVTCSDCHDPHSGKPRLAGGGVCLQCHEAGRFAGAAHHRHGDGAASPGCASCHMPMQMNMVVDGRHDHAFRIPRPDLTVELGVPNACNDCHKDKSAQWAAEAVERWFGPERKGFQRYAHGFHAAANGKAGARKLLAGIAGDDGAPGVARAAALSQLDWRGASADAEIVGRALADADPMVRIGALDALESAPLVRRWTVAEPLLSDPVKAVRLRTALALAVPSALAPSASRERFERAAEEFIAAQRFNADRPEARSALGVFYARRGQFAEAEAEYKAALRLSAQFAPAAINLADLYRQTRRDADAEAVLRAAAGSAPRDAGVRHALGLALVRLKRLEEALAELGHAVELEPSRARYVYVYAVALDTAGRPAEALAHAERLVRQSPDDRDAKALVESLRRQGSARGVGAGP